VRRSLFPQLGPVLLETKHITWAGSPAACSEIRLMLLTGTTARKAAYFIFGLGIETTELAIQ
jgi:hypothetical protein